LVLYKQPRQGRAKPQRPDRSREFGHGVPPKRASDFEHPRRKERRKRGRHMTGLPCPQALRFVSIVSLKNALLTTRHMAFIGSQSNPLARIRSTRVGNTWANAPRWAGGPRPQPRRPRVGGSEEKEFDIVCLSRSQVLGPPPRCGAEFEKRGAGHVKDCKAIRSFRSRFWLHQKGDEVSRPGFRPLGPRRTMWRMGACLYRARSQTVAPVEHFARPGNQILWLSYQKRGGALCGGLSLHEH